MPALPTTAQNSTTIPTAMNALLTNVSSANKILLWKWCSTKKSVPLANARCILDMRIVINARFSDVWPVMMISIWNSEMESFCVIVFKGRCSRGFVTPSRVASNRLDNLMAANHVWPAIVLTSNMSL